MEIINQELKLPILTQKQISLFLKREDKLHPVISGNKYRKLKYNVIAAKDKEKKGLLTFGGAYSNHIVATACAAHENNLKSIGIIRGEELAFKWQENPTLSQAKAYGMELKFITRSEYRDKHSEDFIAKLNTEFPEYYVLPEGGTNDLAVKGCSEILTAEDASFDVICSCVGTGGTISGLINSVSDSQRVIGFPALNGKFLEEEIRKFATNERWELQHDYNFGGYAKINTELVEFINWIKKATTISLDPVYTAKMMFGILDLIKRDIFAPGTRILAIHTGGLQGIRGMNDTLRKKDLPLIKI